MKAGKPPCSEKKIITTFESAKIVPLIFHDEDTIKN